MIVRKWQKRAAHPMVAEKGQTERNRRGWYPSFLQEHSPSDYLSSTKPHFLKFLPPPNSVTSQRPSLHSTHGTLGESRSKLQQHLSSQHLHSQCLCQSLVLRRFVLRIHLRRMDFIFSGELYPIRSFMKLCCIGQQCSERY